MGDSDQAEKASAFLSAIQDPDANVTAFAPVNAAFEALGNATFDAAEVLMFHAVPEMMEEGQGYDTMGGRPRASLRSTETKWRAPATRPRLRRPSRSATPSCTWSLRCSCRPTFAPRAPRRTLGKRTTRTAAAAMMAMRRGTRTTTTTRRTTMTLLKTAASPAKTMPATTRMTLGPTVARRAPTMPATTRMTLGPTVARRAPTTPEPVLPGRSLSTGSSEASSLQHLGPFLFLFILILSHSLFLL